MNICVHRFIDSIDHLRPEGRIKKDKGDWSSACQLEPDKTAFWLKVPSASAAAAVDKTKSDDVVIAVEIKPKGAVMPVGTLVPPGNNRLKYRVARFDAQQRFKAQVGNTYMGQKESLGPAFLVEIVCVSPLSRSTRPSHTFAP